MNSRIFSLLFLLVSAVFAELYQYDSVRIRESISFFLFLTKGPKGNISGIAILVDSKEVCKGISNSNFSGMILVVKDGICLTG